MRFLALLLLVACADPSPRTQVMVFVRAEADVIARAQRLEVEIFGAAPGEERVLRETIVYTDSTSPDFFSLEWPRRVALVPEGQDPNRLFTVVATAYNSGAEFARAEVTSSYLSEQTLTLDVWLRDDCIDRVCVPGNTCVAGTCVDATPIDPCALRVIETFVVPEGCGMPDGGVDTGTPDTGPQDAGVDSNVGPREDAGSDGGLDGGPDAGPPDPLDIYNVVFVSSESFVPGEFGGIDNAHDHCQRLARAAGLPESEYRAFLSTSAASALSVLGDARGFVNVEGRPFADRSTDLAEGKIFYPILLNERGDPNPESRWVVTGTNEDLSTDSTCNDWSSTDGQVTTGNAHDGAPFWLNRRFGFNGNPPVGCNLENPIYCFGVGRRAELDAPETPAETGGIFLSTGRVSAGSGTEAFDALCEDEGGPEYVAFLPSAVGESAISRVGSYRGPWARPDGVLVGDYNDLASGQMLAAINVNATGGYLSGGTEVVGVWSGAVQPDAASIEATTCSAWNDGSTAQNGRVAYFGRARDTYSNSGTYRVQCNISEGFPVFCISTEHLN